MQSTSFRSQEMLLPLYLNIILMELYWKRYHAIYATAVQVSLWSPLTKVQIESIERIQRHFKKVAR